MRTRTLFGGCQLGPLILGLLILLAGLPSGCQGLSKMTLRSAEEMAHTWLRNMQQMLDSRATADARGATAKSGQSAWPSCLRDCFVDDGWVPEGFKNPTEAIAWLTRGRVQIGKVTSIDLKERGAQVVFEVSGTQRATLVAWVVSEGPGPKCKQLVKRSEEVARN